MPLKRAFRLLGACLGCLGGPAGWLAACIQPALGLMRWVPGGLVRHGGFSALGSGLQPARVELRAVLFTEMRIRMYVRVWSTPHAHPNQSTLSCSPESWRPGAVAIQL